MNDTTTRIVRRARALLKGARIGRITFKLLEEGVHKRDRCWYVPVQPSAEPKNMTRYYELLAEIETELFMKDDINVMFVPSDPVPITPKSHVTKPQPSSRRRIRSNGRAVAAKTPR